MSANWASYLPPYKDFPIRPYGLIRPRVLVIHKTIGDKDDGADAASLNRSRATRGEAGTWHWTVGFDGTAWRHLGFHEEGAHDAGINSISVGIEHDLSSNDRPSEAMLRTSAQIAAAFCHFIGRAPDRDFIIGHVEDDLATRDGYPGKWTRWGGDSTHVDPRPAWDWPAYMALVQTYYEEEDMTDEEKQTLADAKTFLDALREDLGAKDAPKKPARPGGAGKRVAAATLKAEATP